MPTAKPGKKAPAAAASSPDGKKEKAGSSLMALANLSAAMSLDDMLSGLEKSKGPGSVHDTAHTRLTWAWHGANEVESRDTALPHAV